MPRTTPERQLRPVHHRPGRYRRLATAVEAFVGVRPAPQERCASVATGRTDKPLRPTPLEQERRTARLVRKARLKLSQRSRPRHPVPPRARRRSPAHGTLILHIEQPGTTGSASRSSTHLLGSSTGIIYWDHLLGSSTGIIERILPEDEGEARLPQIGPHGSSENVAWSRA